MAEAHPQGTPARWPDHQGTDQRGPEVLVLDASAALAWIFDDEREDLPVLLMDAIDRGHAVVPAHWILEVTNGLLLAHRRGRLRPDERPDDILERLGSLPIRVDPETSVRAWRETLVLAESLRLTTYDAAYVELALRLRAPMATLDEGLTKAAGRVGLVVLSGGLANRSGHN